MGTGEQMELHVRRVAAQAVREAARDLGRKEFVLGAGDEQDRGGDGLIFVFFPILWHAAADSQDASSLLRIGADEAIIESDRLREAHEQSATCRNRESDAKVGRNRANDLMVQPNVKIGMAAGTPVVAGFVSTGTTRQKKLIGSPQARDQALVANGWHREPQHRFRIRAVSVEGQH